MAIPYPSTLPPLRLPLALLTDKGRAEFAAESGFVRRWRKYLRDRVTARLEFVAATAELDAWWRFVSAFAWEAPGIEIAGVGGVRFVSQVETLPYAADAGAMFLLSVEAEAVPVPEALPGDMAGLAALSISATAVLTQPPAVDPFFAWFADIDADGEQYLVGALPESGDALISFYGSVLADGSNIHLEFYFPSSGEWAPAAFHMEMSSQSDTTREANHRDNVSILDINGDTGSWGIGNNAASGVDYIVHCKFRDGHEMAGVFHGIYIRGLTAPNLNTATVGSFSIPGVTERPTQFRLSCPPGANWVTATAQVAVQLPASAIGQQQGPILTVSETSDDAEAHEVTGLDNDCFAWIVDIDGYDNDAGENAQQVEFSEDGAVWSTNQCDSLVNRQSVFDTNNYVNPGASSSQSSVDGAFVRLHVFGDGAQGLASPSGRYHASLIVFDPGGASEKLAIGDARYKAESSNWTTAYIAGAVDMGPLTAVRERLGQGPGGVHATDIRVRAVKGLASGQAQVVIAENGAGVSSLTLPVEAGDDQMYSEFLVLLSNFAEGEDPRLVLGADHGWGATQLTDTNQGSGTGSSSIARLMPGTVTIGAGQAAIWLRCFEWSRTTKRAMIVSKMAYRDSGGTLRLAHAGINGRQTTTDDIVLSLNGGGGFDYRAVGWSVPRTAQL